MAAKTPKIKLRATYPKEIRSLAKSTGRGVATVSIEFSNGERLEAQGPIDELQAEFAKWAMAMLFCEDLQLPDLEPLCRKLIHGSQAQER